MSENTNITLTSLARLGAAIISGASPATAGSFALGAVIREVPHLLDLAAVVLATGRLTEEQRARATQEAVALSGGLASIPAADSVPS